MDEKTKMVMGVMYHIGSCSVNRLNLVIIQIYFEKEKYEYVSD